MLSSVVVDRILVAVVDNACSAKAIGLDSHRDLGVHSTADTGEAEVCALDLEDSQVVDSHMAVEHHTDLVDVAHACSQESSSVLVSRRGCCSAREPSTLDTCPSPDECGAVAGLAMAASTLERLVKILRSS